MECTFYVSFPLLPTSRDSHYGGRYGHVQNVLPSRCDERVQVKAAAVASTQARDFMT